VNHAQQVNGILRVNPSVEGMSVTKEPDTVHTHVGGDFGTKCKMRVPRATFFYFLAESHLLIEGSLVPLSKHFH